jgi:hypothetical protein
VHSAYYLRAAGNMGGGMIVVVKVKCGLAEERTQAGNMQLRYLSALMMMNFYCSEKHDKTNWFNSDGEQTNRSKTSSKKCV